MLVRHRGYKLKEGRVLAVLLNNDYTKGYLVQLSGSKPKGQENT